MARSAVTPNYGLSLDTVGNIASDNAIKELALFVDDKTRLFEDRFEDSTPVTLTEFGAVGDGVADDTAAWTAALATGKPIVCGVGKKYRITNNGAVLSARDLVIYGNGSRFILDNPTPAELHFIILDQPFLGTSTVTGITKTTLDISGTSSGLTDVSEIAYSGVEVFKAGEICRIVSDDTLDGAHSSSLMRKGEYFTVGAVAAGKVYSCAPLRYSYTSGIRLCKIDSSRRVKLDNFSVELGPQTPIGTGVANCIRLQGAYRPSLTNIHCESWGKSFLALYGCYDTKTFGLSVTNLTTDSTLGLYGYGIVETGCHGSVHVAPSGSRCRHVYTTVALPLSTNDNEICKYGRNFGTVVIGGLATDCGAAGFDTHPDADAVSFVGCKVINGYTGSDGYQGGFQIRGWDCLVDSCMVVGQIGVFFEGGGSGTDSKGLTKRPRVRNFVHKIPAGLTDSYPYAVTAGGAAGDVIEGIEIDGIHVHAEAGPQVPVMKFAYATAAIRNAFLKVNVANASQVLIQVLNATLTVRKCAIDLTAGTVAGATIFQCMSNTDVIDVDGLEIRAGNYNWADLVDYAGFTAAGNFRNISWDRYPSDFDAVTGGTNATHKLGYDGGWDAPWAGQVIEDHFVGMALNSSLWGTAIGSNGSCAAALVAGTQRGAFRITTGADAGGTVALNGAQIHSAQSWRAQDGEMFIDSRFTPSNATNIGFFLGFMDAITLKAPFALAAGDVLSTTSTDAVGILFDTAADTDIVWGVGVKNGVMVKVNLGNALTSGSQVRWRVIVDASGNARFERNGQAVGTLANAVTASVVLAPAANVYSRSASSKYVQIDYLKVQQGTV